MRVNCRPFAILACSFLLAVFSPAQAVPPVTTKTAPEEKGFTWTETYEGSGNTDGFITDINSTVGYIFDEHFSMDMGAISVYPPVVFTDRHDFGGRHGEPLRGSQILQKRAFARFQHQPEWCGSGREFREGTEHRPRDF